MSKDFIWIPYTLSSRSFDIIFCLCDQNCFPSVILRRIQFSISSIVFLRWQPVPLSRSPSLQIVRIHPETRSSHISATTYLARDPKTVSILHIPAYGSSFGNIREYFQSKLSRRRFCTATTWRYSTPMCRSRQTGSFLSYFIAITARTFIYGLEVTYQL